MLAALSAGADIPDRRISLGSRRGIHLRYMLAPSGIGWILMAGTEIGVTAIAMGIEPTAVISHANRYLPSARLADGDRQLQNWLDRLVGFVERPCDRLDLPLDIAATVFQAKVWDMLRDIPAGQTLSYSDVAAGIGQPLAVRAVASACARNPVALIVPCHRVIGKSGNLTGYYWGVEYKRKLLALEGWQSPEDKGFRSRVPRPGGGR